MSNTVFYRWGIIIVGIMAMVVMLHPAVAGAPSGADTFQLLTSPSTGGDNTGDGGTGSAADFNYYYVGQSFTTDVEIVSGGSTAANIWIDYNSATVTPSNITDGDFYSVWSGQTISPSARGTNLGRLYITGSNIPVTSSAGSGSFGTIDWSMTRPSAAAYGTTMAESFDINIGNVGSTTESNISMSGIDLLDDEEDFFFHVWADTVAPYALNPSPATAATGVSIDVNYLHTLCDSKDGAAGDAGTCLASGVGTGVSTAEPPGSINFNDGGGAVSYTAYDSFSCSGTWGTNQCDSTVNPPAPSGIVGDTRNWEYSTTYTVTIGSFRDLASASQDQLGDANGPNQMATTTYTFTTEADIVAPQVTSETPARSSSGNSVSTNVTVVVQDRKTYPSGPSGTGVASTTCRFIVASPATGSNNYTPTSTEMTVTGVDYGYQYAINPATDFGQNETVTVTVYDCQDEAGNTMTTDIYTFSTSDDDPPYVDQRAPADDSGLAASGTIGFHVKDDGVGVDLATLVVFVNGVYYSDGGGAISVTTVGTNITATSSLDFNGGNYGGDTTGVSGTAADYTFVLDPQADFVAGEAVPVIVYARDTSGNLMIRDVYALSVGGGTGQVCGNGAIEGNEVCDDSNTSAGDGCSANCLSDESCGNSLTELTEECDDGNTSSSDGCSNICEFESTGGGSCVGSGGGIRPPALSISDTSAYITQIDEDSVLVSWYTSLSSDARVVYGPGLITEGFFPDYGYPQTTNPSDDDSKYHAVQIDGLTPGQLYYFRPVSSADNQNIAGPILKMAPLFATQIIERLIVDENGDVVSQEIGSEPVACPATPTGPGAPALAVPGQPVSPGPAPIAPIGAIGLPFEFGITQVNGQVFPARSTMIKHVTIPRSADQIIISGKARPGGTVTIDIY